MNDSLRLAELLSARLCHDLSGLLGSLIGVLEIARAENSAAEGLGLSRGAPVIVRDRTDQP